MTACAHCPISAGLRCPGVDVPRLCDLIDPRHVAYAPAYSRTLWRLAQRTPVDADSSLTAALALERLRAMRACPFRSIDPGCGCAGARCGLRRGEIVAHADCFECVQQYG